MKEQKVQTLKERAENQRKQKLLYIGLGIIGWCNFYVPFLSFPTAVFFVKGKTVGNREKRSQIPNSIIKPQFL